MFDYKKSSFGPNDEARALRWVQILENTGVENVRSKLASLESRIGAGAAIPIGTEPTFTVGFAQEWLAWHDKQKAEAEEKRQNSMRTATICAAVAAGASSIAAIASAILALLVYLNPPHP